ncbi:MAG: universal stress protein [Bacteroidales bacterium]|nr:universal stress protein [Bacteroidales bacterium]
MSDYKNPIIVPWDFSEKAEFALEHALNYSAISGKDVALVHIVKRSKDIEPALKQLDEKIEEAKQKYGRPIHVIVKEGNIFSTITDVIEETDASLAIMGTHGMKGMQKLTGSWALKVITGSKSPFIVVQDPPKERDVSDIVVPVDFKQENKEKLVWMNFINTLFSSKFHLVYIDSQDKFAKKSILSNIKVAVEYLESKGISYEINKLGSKGNLPDKTIEFAKVTDAAMIIIMTTKNIGTLDYVMGASEQTIIANEAKIPVMTINPREGKLVNFT